MGDEGAGMISKAEIELRGARRLRTFRLHRVTTILVRGTDLVLGSLGPDGSGPDNRCHFNGGGQASCPQRQA